MLLAIYVCGCIVDCVSIYICESDVTLCYIICWSFLTLQKAELPKNLHGSNCEGHQIISTIPKLPKNLHGSNSEGLIKLQKGPNGHIQ